MNKEDTKLILMLILGIVLNFIAPASPIWKGVKEVIGTYLVIKELIESKN